MHSAVLQFTLIWCVMLCIKHLLCIYPVPSTSLPSCVDAIAFTRTLKHCWSSQHALQCQSKPSLNWIIMRRLEPKFSLIAVSQCLVGQLMYNSLVLTGLWVLVIRCVGPRGLLSFGASMSPIFIVQPGAYALGCHLIRLPLCSPKSVNLSFLVFS